MPLLVPDSDSVEQTEPMPLIVEEMDDAKGEATHIFSRVREREKEKRKMLEVGLCKTA